MRLYYFLTTSLIALSLTSCATIMHGTRQTIGISSNPTNAAVWVDHTYVTNTPALISMTRGDNHIVHIELEGYQPYDAVFSKQVSGWVFGNVIFGGFIGLAIDAISGGLYRLTPEETHAELRANNMSQTDSSSCVFVVLEPKPSWEKVGHLVSK